LTCWRLCLGLFNDNVSSAECKKRQMIR
jgi:hypothetical protein